MNEKLDRLKSVFDHYESNKSKLAVKLEVTPQYVWKIMNSDGEPSERIILATLKAFPDVNEMWLRTGEGQMFAPASRAQEMASITAQYFSEDDPIRIALARVLAGLTSEQLALMVNVAEKVVEESRKEANS